MPASATSACCASWRGQAAAAPTHPRRSATSSRRSRTSPARFARATPWATCPPTPRTTAPTATSSSECSSPASERRRCTSATATSRRSTNMGDELSLFSAKLPPRRRRHGLVVLERVLLLVALCTLGYVAATLGGAALYQKYESRQLDEILRSGPPPAAGSGTVTLGPRRIIGRIEVPRLGVSTIIKEGDDARTLDLAVGHIRGTALPGGRGNIGLAGHRDTFFRRLQHIET